MDSKLVSYLSPSKAIIFDLENSHCCIVTVARTGHPVTRSYLKMASAKMDAIAEYESELIEYESAKYFVRLRAVDIDNKNSFSATIYVDLIVPHDLSPNETDELKKCTEEYLNPILSIQSVDKFGASYYLELSVRPALLSSDSFHPGMDSYYEKYI